MRCRRILPILLASSLAAGCGGSRPAPRREPSDTAVRSLADTFLNAYFERYPEEATSNGVPGHRHERLTDNSASARSAWESREDQWLRDLTAIDPATIENPRLRATYAIVRQELEGDVASRVCRDELWDVSQQNGWQDTLGYLVTIQPVGSPEARADAIARWSSLPRYVDTEIENLREGLRLGYTAPKQNVRLVIDQVRTLASTAVKDSPFHSPADRDKTPEFVKQVEALITDGINPAARRYADFLEKEYLPKAREALGVAANPNGAACYDASVFAFSTTHKTAKQVHELGLQQMDAISAEMKAIGERSFGTGDVPALMKKVREDPQYRFKSREEKIAMAQAALARAKAAIPAWFNLAPKADVKIEPYPAFREKNAPNEYNPPAEDGSRPAVFFINAYQAEKQSRVLEESTAFHETIPGHHMQVALALERQDIHPIGRYLFNSGYVEGWALYAERLADEMKLYSSDEERLGMLSGQALRAARLVVDSGLHTMGWTRKEAIDYMLAHTGEGTHETESEVDRYIIWPGQATAYMIGMLEIRAARDEAQKAMASRFDIKAFHDRVIEDGSVPLTFLRAKIKAWDGAR